MFQTSRVFVKIKAESLSRLWWRQLFIIIIMDSNKLWNKVMTSNTQQIVHNRSFILFIRRRWFSQFSGTQTTFVQFLFQILVLKGWSPVFSCLITTWVKLLLVVCFYSCFWGICCLYVWWNKWGRISVQCSPRYWLVLLLTVVPFHSTEKFKLWYVWCN